MKNCMMVASDVLAAHHAAVEEARARGRSSGAPAPPRSAPRRCPRCRSSGPRRAAGPAGAGASDVDGGRRGHGLLSHDRRRHGQQRQGQRGAKVRRRRIRIVASLQRGLVALAGADADRRLDGRHEDLAVADRARCGPTRRSHPPPCSPSRRAPPLDLDLRKEVDRVLRSRGTARCGPSAGRSPGPPTRSCRSTPMSVRVSFTSSSLKGLMIASIFFMRPPSGRAARRPPAGAVQRQCHGPACGNSAGRLIRSPAPPRGVARRCLPGGHLPSKDAGRR